MQLNVSDKRILKGVYFSSEGTDDLHSDGTVDGLRCLVTASFRSLRISLFACCITQNEAFM